MATVLPTITRAAGDYAVGPVAIADNVQTLNLSVLYQTSADMTIWPNASDIITFDIQVSLDGVTWQQWFNGSNGGGLHINSKTGAQMPAMFVEGSIPAGTGRRMRANINLSASIKTGATVVLS